MKLLFSCVFLVMFTAIAAQNCNDYIQSEADRITGKMQLRSKEPLFVTADPEKSVIAVSWSRNANEYVLAIGALSTNASRCIEKDAQIDILFRDKTYIHLTNDLDFNCDGMTAVYFGGIWRKRKQLNHFLEKEIETIRVWTYKGQIIEDLTLSDSEILRETLRCLMSEI